MVQILRSAMLALTVCIAGMVATADPAHAFRLVPIEMEFEPSGRGATQIFRVENEGAGPVAVEIRIEARGMKENGDDVRTPADDDWVIFPEQIILQPNETQSVRVQYVGDPSPGVEKAYRLTAEQLNIDVGRPQSQGGQVRLLVTYVASIYVMPADVRPSVEVVAAQAAPDGQLELVLRNVGTSRQILREPTLRLAAAGQSVTLRPEQLEGFAGENILAGVTRRFLLPWPDALPKGAVRAELTLP